MATTTMTRTNSSTVAKWEKKSWVQGIRQTGLGELVSGNCVYDASKDFAGDNGRGDNLTFNYVGKLTGIPLGEGSTGFGNEEALNLGTHNMRINLTRLPVANPNKGSIEQQRTNVDFDEVTANLQMQRLLELADAGVFNHLGGSNPTSFTLDGTTYSGDDRLQVQGHNAPTAPTSGRILRPGGAANDQSLTSADKMSLDLLDDAFAEITDGQQPIKPCADGYFKVFMSPKQLRDLRKDSAGKVQWYQNELAKEAGGKESALTFQYDYKPVAMGRYLNMVIYQAPRVAFGVNASTSAVITTVRRAVIVGRDALSFASPVGGISAGDKAVPSELYVQLSDYDYVKGMDLRTIYGVKKMSPSNAEDIGVFVIPTYAA
jgi:hypothetical protein